MAVRTERERETTKKKKCGSASIKTLNARTTGAKRAGGLYSLLIFLLFCHASAYSKDQHTVTTTEAMAISRIFLVALGKRKKRARHDEKGERVMVKVAGGAGKIYVVIWLPAGDTQQLRGGETLQC